MVDDRPIIVECDGGVRIITLNDPQSMNAASVSMVDCLIEELSDASKNARAVLLTGSGRAFCSGANLGRIPDPMAPDYDAGLLLETHYHPLMRAVQELEVPLVTAVNGAAAGLGAALALAGDISLASRSAYFKMAFDKIGLVCDAGAAFLLVHAAGRPRAMEMLLLGERVPAELALAWGMINRLIDDGNLMVEARAMAQRLASGPTRAFGMVRKIMRDSMETSYTHCLDLERELQREAGRTSDHREGLAAFFGKRDPQFTGDL